MPGGHERYNGSAPAVALGGGPVIFTQANSSIRPRHGFIGDDSADLARSVFSQK
jgi:hypothetical protein